MEIGAIVSPEITLQTYIHSLLPRPSRCPTSEPIERRGGYASSCTTATINDRSWSRTAPYSYDPYSRPRRQVTEDRGEPMELGQLHEPVGGYTEDGLDKIPKDPQDLWQLH